MSEAMKLGFAPLTLPRKGILILFAGETVKFGSATRKLLGQAEGHVSRAARVDGFTGKSGTALEIIAPQGLKVSRVVVIGVGKALDFKPQDYVRYGGAAAGRIPSSAEETAIVLDLPFATPTADEATDLVLGCRLRGYSFDRYKTKRKDGGEQQAKSVTFLTPEPAVMRRAWNRRQGIADGVILARDLVNEPPNVLFPAEFARRATALKKLGVSVQILDARALKRLGLRALLAVGQGSDHESRMVVMRWNGARGAPPIAFIGKGVTFDTGGISIKPAQGMEDMKGDMAGAACVVGLMQALAARKAKVNAVAAIGLVENMPDGKAQRPGDIVTSMSGQTIEVINTDAEGRLVLADVLHYVNTRFKPRFMIDLATLTGAIVIALGHEHAGLFSNDDRLAERLVEAGNATGERVWRMPLGPEYDKLIDSKVADVKNTGGRHAGSITAAQFLKRFVGTTPWAHLDIAGTGMASPQNDVNKSWASGFGVRLLDRLVADHYEK